MPIDKMVDIELTTSQAPHSPSSPSNPAGNSHADLVSSCSKGTLHKKRETVPVGLGDSPKLPIPIDCDDCDRDEGRDNDNGKQTTKGSRETPLIIDESHDEQHGCISAADSTPGLPRVVTESKRRRSSFLRTALGCLDRISDLRRRSNPVVEQPDSLQSARKRKSDSESTPKKRRATEKRKRKGKKKALIRSAQPKQTDEERKASLELNPLVLVQALEDCPEEQSGERERFEEWARLLKASADPNINTRDPECEAQELPSTAIAAATVQEKDARVSTSSPKKARAASPILSAARSSRSSERKELQSLSPGAPVQTEPPRTLPSSSKNPQPGPVGSLSWAKVLRTRAPAS
ncbi:hypothetical protein SODALDRAFT_362394 [Sodiomyces alkalinus F11]|uniref:Uncharacterized protein n=1 Tax=Sodiomyces alkalinus (strain CBS 110278 / VKM F-3762 / F11) TaxID=1314773 RepID=A0A3N2PPZ8_SODAK|nr:hypothetical protein SODALDRAFT_362394 [Sodiomyces alkalinus F11]ROT36579.1 hypothetical protein SODALDRAFT_362394 [Sodiomyces alkalinus F11]